MHCFEPGQVLVMPALGGVGFIRDVWRRFDTGIGLDVFRSVEDILHHYKINEPEFTHTGKEIGHERIPVLFKAYPVIVRVPEGKELESAEAIRKHPDIAVAIPNFLVRPEANLSIAEDVFSQSLDCVTANPPSAESCGLGVRVAIVDTGVDPKYLQFAARLHRRQFSVDGPALDEAAETPEDRDGHGSVVARIINGIAPAANLLSVRAVEEYGNLGGVVAALYVAQAAFRPHIINLSFSLACDLRGICASCGNATGVPAALTLDQVRYLFSLVDEQLEGFPLLIAAAGNNSRTIQMPASFPNVLAIGACELDLSVPEYASFDSVDPQKFLVAPGGNRGNQAYAHRRGVGPGTDFYGTSFSAAVVSGIAARYACASRGGQCSGGNPPAATGREFLVECLRSSAVRDFAEYNPNKHGLGIARYDRGTAIRTLH